MIIGVPRWTFADVFLKIESTKNPAQMKYSGFCIEVFQEVAKILGLQYEFVAFNGSYADLIDCVANKRLCASLRWKTFDAAVGDITILADRWKLVDFSAPFTKIGVSLVAQLKPEISNPWMFLTRFAVELWVAIAAISIYIMFLVWFFEHRSNPEFNGPWNDQLGNALWFTFSSVFFSQREHIQYNYTRMVVVVWLFVVLILTQSYGARLTSMLTVSRLQTNVEQLRKTNVKVGYFGTTYIREYLQKALQFKFENIQEMNVVYDLSVFENHGGISAAFVEAPYAKVVVNEYCKKYAIIGPTYRFGRFGFVSKMKNFQFLETWIFPCMEDY
ncbi:hypothetical protein F0562_018350 [Nyssa sinensis]|uniref:Ionotropic glutamate receptor C-terminal domain-containing protein n=1 Tax=Nyssa sinensis TaxID=561372 RepID=A0A5J4ZD44_9ASTE|nr:hypothetical protein F0562_018350 [Nyssa sinensis]